MLLIYNTLVKYVVVKNVVGSFVKLILTRLLGY